MIIIHPQGRLGNQMFQLMLALELRQRIGRKTPIIGYNLPDWGLAAPAPGKTAETTAHLKGHCFNLDQIAYLLRSEAIQQVRIHGWGMRLEYYAGPSRFQSVFQTDVQPGFAGSERELLIHVRAEDITNGWHPKYFPVCFAYYEQLIAETRLEPVFMGQLDPSPYTEALMKRFSGARFLKPSTPLKDFQSIRQSVHIALSVSSFSWLAAWLSNTARTIHLPVCGLFDPCNPETMLLPVDDPRYRFYQVPFPVQSERATLDVIRWAHEASGGCELSRQSVKAAVVDAMTAQNGPARQRASTTSVV